MTICIAAACEGGRTLIVAADRELGIGITSAEFDSKFLHLYAQWTTGIAGTVTHATDVIAVARKSQPESYSAWDVQSSIAKAYRQARLAKAEALYLANRGWTLDTFRTVGAKQLPTDTYAAIDAQISVYNFGADLILAGFGQDDAGPSILSVTNPGVCIDHSKIGFWCVGSGAIAAQMSLFSREYSITFSAEKAALYIYEAKVDSEHASGVGLTTDIFLIRKIYEKLRVLPIEKNTIGLMEKIRKQLAPRELSSRQHQLLKDAPEFSELRISP